MVICNLPSVGMYYIFLDCVFGLKQLLQITFSVRGLRIDGAERLLLLTAHINTVFWQTFFFLIRRPPLFLKALAALTALTF